MPFQGELNFSQSPQGDGLQRWQTQRERASHRLARRLGLPLDREVEVCLKDGVVLRGHLRLKEAMLFLDNVNERTLELAVGRVDFRYGDIESCVSMD
jgi:hypothetical protein